MAEYVSRFTGTEIDEAVDKARNLSAANLSIDAIAGVAAGNVQEALQYLSAHSGGESAVKTVNGLAPDEQGNLQLLPGQIGAVAAPVGLNLTFWVGTQAEYNALSIKDSSTLYCVTD